MYCKKTDLEYKDIYLKNVEFEWPRVLVRVPIANNQRGSDQGY